MIVYITRSLELRLKLVPLQKTIDFRDEEDEPHFLAPLVRATTDFIQVLQYILIFNSSFSRMMPST